MKLATFSTDGVARIGLVQEDMVLDLAAIDPGLPLTMRGLLEAGAIDHVRGLASKIAPRIPLDQVRLHAPVGDPRKFLGLGLNLRSHFDEQRAKGRVFPAVVGQAWFNKQVTCVNGPYDPIHLPRVSTQLDYEGELALVIGMRCRHLRKDEARKAIAGFMVCNDVSVRDWQARSPTAMLGKSFDTHGPIGPFLTTADAVDDPENLSIRTFVDGELRQNGSTTEFIHSIGEMLEELTAAFTLEPGDVLTTGTPAGVGAAHTPPRFLRAGQIVRVEIEGLGHLENKVIPEP